MWRRSECFWTGRFARNAAGHRLQFTTSGRCFSLLVTACCCWSLLVAGFPFLFGCCCCKFQLTFAANNEGRQTGRAPVTTGDLGGPFVVPTGCPKLSGNEHLFHRGGSSSSSSGLGPASWWPLTRANNGPVSGQWAARQGANYFPPTRSLLRQQALDERRGPDKLEPETEYEYEYEYEAEAESEMKRSSQRWNCTCYWPFGGADWARPSRIRPRGERLHKLAACKLQ